MDSGAWALVAVGALGLIGTVYATYMTRRSDKSKSDVSNFEANIRAFNLRAKNAEERAVAAEKKSDELAKRVETLEKKDDAREAQLNRIRMIVQTWFRDLRAAWPADHPMPLPSPDDLDILGITIPRIPDEQEKQ